jgi:hypothetical protein
MKKQTLGRVYDQVGGGLRAGVTPVDSCLLQAGDIRHTGEGKAERQIEIPLNSDPGVCAMCLFQALCTAGDG